MTLHQKVRRIYLVCVLGASIWMVYSFQAQGVDPSILESNEAVSVTESPNAWEFVPAASPPSTGFIFFPGGMVDPTAYAPMAHALAEQGFRTVIIKLPLRSAPFAGQETAVFATVYHLINEPSTIEHWMVGGHSRGGAIAARFAHTYPQLIDGLVLIGTSHPKENAYSLAAVSFPVLKIYASRDGLASPSEIEQNKVYLPNQTRYVEIEGGNHAQFGWYGSQLGDNRATISRETQQNLMLETISTFLYEPTVIP